MSRTYAQKILVFCTFSVRNFVSIKHIDKSVCFVYNIMALEKRAFYGGIAQLARALGSYPNGRWFKSDFRYQYGSLVKRLRHRPFTAVTRVRFPYESPIRNPITTKKSLWLWDFSHLRVSLKMASDTLFSSNVCHFLRHFSGQIFS